jgi:hypothetical protein
MLALLFGAVSLLYATVGQAGGTAFPALMAFASFPSKVRRPTGRPAVYLSHLYSSPCAGPRRNRPPRFQRRSYWEILSADKYPLEQPISADRSRHSSAGISLVPVVSQPIFSSTYKTRREIAHRGRASHCRIIDCVAKGSKRRESPLGLQWVWRLRLTTRRLPQFEDDDLEAQMARAIRG